MELNLRLLTPEEYPLVAPMFEEKGLPPPESPEQAILIGAFDETGEGTGAPGLLGFFMLSFQPYAEPLWVREDQRGRGIGSLLTAQMISFCRELGLPQVFFGEPTRKEIFNIARKAGAEPLPGRVWVKKLG